MMETWWDIQKKIGQSKTFCNMLRCHATSEDVLPHHETFADNLRRWKQLTQLDEFQTDQFKRQCGENGLIQAFLILHLMSQNYLDIHRCCKTLKDSMWRFQKSQDFMWRDETFCDMKQTSQTFSDMRKGHQSIRHTVNSTKFDFIVSNPDSAFLHVFSCCSGRSLNCLHMQCQLFNWVHLSSVFIMQFTSLLQHLKFSKMPLPGNPCTWVSSSNMGHIPLMD